MRPERCLELLEHKGLWTDIDWRTPALFGMPFDRMTEALASSADRIFRREHVDRLRALLVREKANLSPTTRGRLIVAISRLLPTADPKRLDDVDTRDGVLRAAAGSDDDAWVRAIAAAELIAAGLPQNWSFLKTLFFADANPDPFGSVRLFILDALGKPPLGPEKRAALRDLLLDKQFLPLWTDADHRRRIRVYPTISDSAIQAVNAHAGKTVLDRRYCDKMNDPRQAEKTLPEVLRIIAATLAEEATPPRK
jgi:hypothetical protein